MQRREEAVIVLSKCKNGTTMRRLFNAEAEAKTPWTLYISSCLANILADSKHDLPADGPII